SRRVHRGRRGHGDEIGGRGIPRLPDPTRHKAARRKNWSTLFGMTTLLGVRSSLRRAEQRNPRAQSGVTVPQEGGGDGGTETMREIRVSMRVELMCVPKHALRTASPTRSG